MQGSFSSSAQGSVIGLRTRKRAVTAPIPGTTPSANSSTRSISLPGGKCHPSLVCYEILLSSAPLGPSPECVPSPRQGRKYLCLRLNSGATGRI